jgi:ribonucleoside-diphosphate reductase alpha chain
MVKSLMDYLGRWLALKFLAKEKALKVHNKELVEKAYAEGTKSKEAFVMSLPVVDEGTQQPKAMHSVVAAIAETDTKVSAAEQAKLQGYTGSACSSCGSSKMKRNGSCEVCIDCGVTSGCS